MNFVNQEVELQPMVDAIYSARVSKEIRVRQILNLFRSYSEYEVIQAISYLIFRYQAHLEASVPSRKGWENAAVFSRTETGCIYSRRMVNDERIRTVRAESGKLGGNPDLLKQKPGKEDNL